MKAKVNKSTNLAERPGRHPNTAAPSWFFKHEQISGISIRNYSLFTLNVDANNELKQFEKEKRKSMCKWMKRKRMRMRKSKVCSAVKAGSSTPEGFSFAWQETTLPVIWTKS